MSPATLRKRLPLCLGLLLGPLLGLHGAIAWGQDQSLWPQRLAWLKSLESLGRTSPEVLKRRQAANFRKDLLWGLKAQNDTHPQLQSRCTSLIAACLEGQAVREALRARLKRPCDKTLKAGLEQALQRTQVRESLRYWYQSRVKEQLSSHALKELRILLTDPAESKRSREQRNTALTWYGQRSPFDAELFLTVLRHSHDDASARMTAARVLNSQAPNRSGELLPDLLSDSNEAVFQFVLRTTKRVTKSTRSALMQSFSKNTGTPDFSAREQLRLCELAARFRWDEVSKSLYRWSNQSSTALTVRVEALNSLLAMDKTDASQSAKTLVELFPICPHKDRWRVVRTLGHINSNVVAASLEPFFDSQDSDLRRAAILLAESLQLRESSLKIRRLALNAEEFEDIRAKAIRFLGKTKNSRNRAAILRCIKSNSSVLIRRVSAEALGFTEFRGPECDKALVRALDDSELEVQRAALKSLAVVAGDQAKEALVSRLLSKPIAASLHAQFVDTCMSLELESARSVLTKLNVSQAAVATKVLEFYSRFPEKECVPKVIQFLNHRQLIIRNKAWRLLLIWVPSRKLSATESDDLMRYKPSLGAVQRRARVKDWQRWWQKRQSSVLSIPMR